MTDATNQPTKAEAAFEAIEDEIAAARKFIRQGRQAQSEAEQGAFLALVRVRLMAAVEISKP